MSVSQFFLSILGAFSQSVPLVRSRCICTGRGCTFALGAATTCKATFNVFRMKRALYKSNIIINKQEPASMIHLMTMILLHVHFNGLLMCTKQQILTLQRFTDKIKIVILYKWMNYLSTVNFPLICGQNHQAITCL